MARIRVIAGLTAVVLMSGCGSIYKQESSCPGYIENGHCRDLRETYEATHDYDRDEYRQLLRAQQQEGERRSKSRRGGGDRSPKQPPSPQEVRDRGYAETAVWPYMVADEQPRPILTQAIPVRVFVDPFEDNQGRLHTPGLVYVRATEPRWIFGRQETSESRVVSPLVPNN